MFTAVKLIASHQGYLFLSNCGMLKHKLIATHRPAFCVIEQHPLDYRYGAFIVLVESP